jgi:NAD(P)-dependent dehydrogenase (short-subunit alcohol dehydrogenase family)
MISLENKKVFITGASRGIGAGIATTMAAAGADVVVTYHRKADEAEQVAEACRQHGRKAYALQCVVTNLESVSEAMAKACEKLGSIDTVVANAGIPSGGERVEDLDPKWWQKLIDTNLTGGFYTLKTAVPYVRRAGGGAIITVSSVAADICGANGVAYNAAKAGLNALTMTLSREVAAEKIRVNAIAPGLVATDMGDMLVRMHGEEAMVSTIPLGRMGKPEEIGDLATYLASDAGSWMTGKILRIDGGLVVQP